MSQPLQFILMVLAAYRVWHLGALDTILDAPRTWLEEHSVKLSDFITCPWCAGFWISIATVLVVDAFSSVELPVLQMIAVSGAVGLLESWL
jgi:hypothetical protein